MKWFHHECAAKYDPKLHLLGEAFGAEGVGVYWGLLEEIGYHSDTFHVRVAGVSAHSDEAYLEALLHGEGPMDPVHVLADENVPIIHLGILARLLFTTEERLLGIIEKSVALGLFDPSKWRTYGLLHSPAFEQRADNYTRRRRRRAEGGRENSERPPNDAPARFAAPPNDLRVRSAAPLNDASARSDAGADDAGMRFAAPPNDSRALPDHRMDTAPADDGLSSDNVRTLAGHRPDIDPADDGLCSDNVCTLAGHSPASVRHESETSPQRDRTSPNNVLPEQTTEQKQKEKEIQKQKEREIKSETEDETKNEKESRNEERKEIKKNLLLCSVPSILETPAGPDPPREPEEDDEAVLIPSAARFNAACKHFREMIRDWNEYEQSRVDWVPTTDELKKLFYGGSTEHKLWLSRQSMNLQGGRVDFPWLVIRALRLMLEATRTKRVQNPFGWVWSCLHGTPEGMAPWVHLPTTLEEADRLRGSRHPP